MRRLLLALVLCAAMVGVGAAPATAATGIAAHGTFEVRIDDAPTPQPLPGDRCLATIPVTLLFTGTLEGAATGTVRIAFDAPCDRALTDPPGTYADVFAFPGRFVGTVAGVETSAGLLYTGLTRPGGEVRGLIALHGDSYGLLWVEGTATEGGVYSGAVRA